MCSLASPTFPLGKHVALARLSSVLCVCVSRLLQLAAQGASKSFYRLLAITGFAK